MEKEKSINDSIEDNSHNPDNAPLSGFSAFNSKWMVTHKLLYVTINMYIYNFHTILPLIFTQKAGWKLQWNWYGLITTVLVGNFVGGKFWGEMADRTGKHKKIIIGTAFAYSFLGFLVCFPEYIVGSKESTFYFRMVYAYLLFFAFNFILSAAFPLTDRLVLGMLAANPNATKDSHGFQRLWGAAGHLFIGLGSIAALGIFAKNPNYTAEQNKNLEFYKWISICFIQVFCTIVYSLAVWLFVPDNIKASKGGHGHGAPAAKKAVASDDNDNKDFDKDEGSDDDDSQVVSETRTPTMILMSNPGFVMFMAFIMCSGIVRCITTNYQKLIVINSVPSKSASHGLYVAAMTEIPRALSEVSAYILSPLFKRVLGVYWVLMFSQIAGIVRLFGYGILKRNKEWTSWFSYTLELLKGFSSGLISCSAIPIANEMAPAGCETTAQTMYSGMYSGLSFGVGGTVCFVAISIFQYYGWGMDKAEALRSEFDGSKLSPEEVDLKIQSMAAVFNAQTLFVGSAFICSIVTISLMAKFIFVDHVMGIPGYPARRSI